jgi:hypothetical protein
MMGPSNVFIEDLPAAKTLDMATCALPPKNQIIMGSPNVFINDQLAARMGDLMFHGGVIASGSATVGIGIPRDGLQVKAVMEKEDIKAIITSETENKQNENKGDDGKVDDKKNPDKKTSVTAEFELASPEPLKMDREVIFRCRSWDTDTGGSQESPNPSSITIREWKLEGEGISPHILQTENQMEWKLTLVGYFPDEQQEVLITVQLSVTDAQGDKGNVSRTFKVHRLVKPKAIIKRVNDNPADGLQSAEFRCESYDPDYMGPPATPDRIKSRKWKSSDSSIIEINDADGQGRQVVVKPIPSIKKQDQVKAVTVTLYVENFHGESDMTFVEMSLIPPVSKIKPLNRSSRIDSRLFGSSDVFIAGDTLRIESISHLLNSITINEGIDKYTWIIHWSAWNDSSGGDGKSIHTEYSAEQIEYEFTEPGSYRIGLRVDNVAGSSFSEVAITIEPYFMNLGEAIAKALQAGSIAVAVTLLSQWIAAGTLITAGGGIVTFGSSLAFSAFEELLKGFWNIEDRTAKGVVMIMGLGQSGAGAIKRLAVTPQKDAIRTLYLSGDYGAKAADQAVKEIQLAFKLAGSDLSELAISQGINDILNE